MSFLVVSSTSELFNLGCRAVAYLSPNAPHLLKLHPDFVKSLSDDGNEDVLHQPS